MRNSSSAFEWSLSCSYISRSFFFSSCTFLSYSLAVIPVNPFTIWLQILQREMVTVMVLSEIGHNFFIQMDIGISEMMILGVSLIANLTKIHSSEWEKKNRLIAYFLFPNPTLLKSYFYIYSLSQNLIYLTYFFSCL